MESVNVFVEDGVVTVGRPPDGKGICLQVRRNQEQGGVILTDSALLTLVTALAGFLSDPVTKKSWNERIGEIESKRRREGKL